ncbi:glutathione peroxidase [Candidatus Latescibacterota bacterium]
MMSNVTKSLYLTLLLVTILVISSCGQQEPQVVVAERTAYDFMIDDIHGGTIDLSAFKGNNVTMFVNTASECGLTPQFTKLQELYDKYRGQGFTIIGFPSDSFKQEPLAGVEIVTFCTDNFLVTFPLAVKTDVKGPDKNPLYVWLTDPANNPEFPQEQGEISWNFEKFIVDRDGKIVGRFKPEVEPDDPYITATIEAAISGSI